MPLYEYQCESCGVRFEVIQKFSDHSVDTCRTCGGKVRRLLSAPAIQFKGTGWYITDYARKGKGGSDVETSSSSSTGSSTPSTKTESSSDSTSTSTAPAAPSSTSASAPSTGEKK
jgi:putative FmdB family regulatory protein